MNGADALCETLLANQVDVCFANPGTSEMHFVAALDKQPKMRCILGLFEGVVTGAADGYARMADKPAATLLHTGPGLANGLANMHNARRAHTPMVNIVGDHAREHLRFDAPLTSDIESLARPMSDWVHRIDGPEDVSRSAAAAIAASLNGAGGVSTLILPADAAWSEAPAAITQAPTAARTEVQATALSACAQALKKPAKTLILLSGKALRDPALKVAERIAQKTGAKLLAQQSNARIERGLGRVAIDRVPYSVDLAVKLLEGFEQIILVGAKSPVAFFAYPGKPSSLIPAQCQVLELTRPSDDALGALQALADAVGAKAGAQESSALASAAAPALSLSSTEAINPMNIALALAQLIPANAIVCDESVSSGREFFKYTMRAQPHDFLQLTGGAIGVGIPMSVGAAVACPERKVILMQADGSGMYTVQGLWTQAREKLDVINIIFANRAYSILQGEFKSVGAGTPGKNASTMLNLDNPFINWVQLANSCGVEGKQVSTIAQFADVMRSALQQKGPFLIEVLI